MLGHPCFGFMLPTRFVHQFGALFAERLRACVASEAILAGGRRRAVALADGVELCVVGAIVGTHANGGRRLEGAKQRAVFLALQLNDGGLRQPESFASRNVRRKDTIFWTTRFYADEFVRLASVLEDRAELFRLESEGFRVIVEIRFRLDEHRG